MSKSIKLRIAGGPTAHDARVIDSETGAELRGVVDFSIFLSAQRTGEPARAHLTIVDFDYDMECAATAERFGLAAKPVPRWLHRARLAWAFLNGR
jgi:hypothetical protein